MKIKYHFFGKDCIIPRDLSDRQDLSRALTSQHFACTKTLFVNQIHSNEVVVVDRVEKIYGDQNLPKADALVTNLPNLVIAIVTADCSPILFFDEEKKIIAAAHAGWRGAKSGIIKSTVAAMKNLGAQNISVLIGPMIQQESYQISQEFFDEFLSEDVANKKFFVNGVTADKYQFDLPAYVKKNWVKRELRKSKMSELILTKMKKIFSVLEDHRIWEKKTVEGMSR